jgi:hypothetical protein
MKLEEAHPFTKSDLTRMTSVRSGEAEVSGKESSEEMART